MKPGVGVGVGVAVMLGIGEGVGVGVGVAFEVIALCFQINFLPDLMQVYLLLPIICILPRMVQVAPGEGFIAEDAIEI